MYSTGNYYPPLSTLRFFRPRYGDGYGSNEDIPTSGKFQRPSHYLGREAIELLDRVGCSTTLALNREVQRTPHTRSLFPSGGRSLSLSLCVFLGRRMDEVCDGPSTHHNLQIPLFLYRVFRPQLVSFRKRANRGNIPTPSTPYFHCSCNYMLAKISKLLSWAVTPSSARETNCSPAQEPRPPPTNTRSSMPCVPATNPF